MTLPLRNPALRDFWRTPARNRVLYGGRSSSKSWDAAAEAIFLASHCKIRVLCTRQFQNRIADSVYALLKIQIERLGLQSIYKITDNRIICTKTGSEFMFYGLWRSIDEIKSLESVDIHWAEEAHLLTAQQWEVIEPTIRAEGSQHWIIFNPRLSSDFVYQRFILNPPPSTITRLINYTENPYLSDTIKAVIDNARREDYESYEHIYLGVPNDNDDDSVIKFDHIRAAIDAHKVLGISIDQHAPRIVGFDVADSGEDSCATVDSHGSLATGIELWKAKEDELVQSTSRVHLHALSIKADKIIYDAIGVGAGVGSNLNGMYPTVRHEKFFAGGAVVYPEMYYGNTQIKNKDMFANIKAQAWWSVADRLKNTYNAVKRGQEFDVRDMIFIDANIEHLDKLMTELTAPKRTFDRAGRVLVESKIDMKKRGVMSPNCADAFLMSFLSVSPKPIQTPIFRGI